MVDKPSKLVRFVERFYIVVKASVFFWIGLIRFGVVYGFLYAMRSTWKYLDSEMAYYESYQSITQGERVSMPYEKLLSFLLTMSLCFGSVGFYTFAKQESVFLLIIGYVNIIWAILLGIFIVYYISNYSRHESREQQLIIIYESMKQMFIKPTQSFFLLSLFIFVGIIFLFSKFIFIFLIPGVCFELIRRVFPRDEEMNEFYPEN